MPDINITVAHKVAVSDTTTIVCDNSDYTVHWTLDEDWSDYDTKTMRTIYMDGTYEDKVFSGTEVELPVCTVPGAVQIGLFAGDIRTSRVAILRALPSVRSAAGAPADPSESVYDQLMELINGMGGADPDVIAKAVADYLAAHPIEETDPTVPEWAKAAITGATVGQIAKITAVDSDGKPTGWEPADMPSDGTWELIHEQTLNAAANSYMYAVGSVRAAAIIVYPGVAISSAWKYGYVNGREFPVGNSNLLSHHGLAFGFDLDAPIKFLSTITTDKEFFVYGAEGQVRAAISVDNLAVIESIGIATPSLLPEGAKIKIYVRGKPMKIYENGKIRDMTAAEIAAMQDAAARAEAEEKHRPLSLGEVQEMMVRAQINTLAVDDATALRMVAYYPEWAAGTAYAIGDRLVYNGDLYKVLQAHTAQETWLPGAGTESLYTRIDEQHDGSKYAPIPYSGNMALENGKYYSQSSVTYLCIRDTGNPVYNALAELVGLYVTVV